MGLIRFLISVFMVIVTFACVGLILLLIYIFYKVVVFFVICGLIIWFITA